MDFVEFNKIARLSRNCVITEKIDGTNASVVITETGDFLVGSRTRGFRLGRPARSLHRNRGPKSGR